MRGCGRECTFGILDFFGGGGGGDGIESNSGCTSYMIRTDTGFVKRNAPIKERVVKGSYCKQVVIGFLQNFITLYYHTPRYRAFLINV